MRETLTSINKKNHVKLGEYNFSPLMELSAGLVLNYCDELNLNKCKKVPLILCFPQKKGAALWTTIISLTNAFLDDYIKNVVEGIRYNDGDKVLIYGCVCGISRIAKEQIVLEYKDQTVTIQARDNFSINHLLTKMSKVKSSRSLNKRSKYIAGLKLAKVNRNSISKILIPNDAEIINGRNLDSKVLLIAGRGNVKAFHDLLNDTMLYEEKLSKTFGLDKNLIIKPDLKPYIHFFRSEIKLKLEEFKKTLIKFLEIDNGANVKIKVSSFLQRLEHEDGLSEDFEDDFLLFIEEHEEEIEQLKFVATKFPGVQEALPKKLKAVVINDIRQLNEYPETIKGFLAQNIPVVVVSNRNVSHVIEIEFYDNLFNANPEYYRINWNRKKIQALIKCASESNFIDEELWKQSKRYATQQIKIKVFEGCDLDYLIGQLLKAIKELDEFTRLQKAFYKYFYPALYALKNSNKKTVEVTNLISEFKYIFDDIKGNGLPESIITLFEKGIRTAYDFENNSKVYNTKHNIFANSLPTINHKDFYIPIDIHVKNLPSSEKTEIVFTGYPYQEYREKYLLNSVCSYYIPSINMLCWPHEGSLTYNYLIRRLEAGYFSDNLDEKYNFPAKYLFKEKTEFIAEIDSFLSVDSIILDEQDQEVDLTYLHTFKYKGFGIENDTNISFSVKCDIINFENGSFLFLPNRSKILAQTEDIYGKLKVSKKTINELNVGDKIFKYIKDRHAMRDIAKSNNTILKHFEKLEYWKITLDGIYEDCDSSVSKLKLLLERTKQENNLDKGNPSKLNIRNWLFDDEFLKPENENLRMIFLANKEPDIENRLKELDISYQHIVAYTIGLSTQIKKQIANQLSLKSLMDADLNIIISGSKIIVQSRRIVSIDKNDMEVDYRNTRKILC